MPSLAKRPNVLHRRSDRSATERVAFTLLELMIVLSVLALVAAIATPRVAGIRQQMLYEHTLSRLTAMDGQLRSLAAKTGAQLEMHVDLDLQTLHCESAENRGTHYGVSLSLPRSTSIVELISASQRKQSGEAIVRFGSHGSGETYAVRLNSADTNGQWLVFCGVTGQVTRWESRQAVETIFEELKN